MRYVNDTGISCFRIIKVVLDELYENLPTPSDIMTKDEIIRGKMRELRSDYRNLTNSSIMPEYNDPYKCFAYLYRYVSAHANVVYELVRQSPDLKYVFDASQIQVSCLGGGPGSDLLGIHKYIISKDLKNNPELICYFYDKQELWLESLKCMCAELRKMDNVRGYFKSLDIITSQSDRQYLQKLYNSDLITMSFFISEVFTKLGQGRDFFIELFKRAKSGAVFLFVDNGSSKAELWFDTLVDIHNNQANSGFLRVLDKGNYDFQMESNENKKDLGCYFEKFHRNFSPKLQTSNEYPYPYRVCRKD